MTMTDDNLKSLIEVTAKAAAAEMRIAMMESLDTHLDKLGERLHARISACQKDHESRLRWRFERWLSIFAILVAIGGTIAANWR